MKRTNLFQISETRWQLLSEELSMSPQKLKDFASSMATDWFLAIAPDHLHYSLIPENETYKAWFNVHFLNFADVVIDLATDHDFIKNLAASTEEVAFRVLMQSLLEKNQDFVRRMMADFISVQSKFILKKEGNKIGELDIKKQSLSWSEVGVFLEGNKLG